MTRQAIIERTIKAINQLPEEKAEEISDFADFVIKKFEDNRITESIKQLASKSQVFDFLNDEEDLYSSNDLKVKYNGQR
jgi:antirestriction protein